MIWLTVGIPGRRGGNVAESMVLPAPASDEEPLTGKVALLFAGVEDDGHSIAVSLAQQGADVALVYRRVGRARETKELVEAEGRRCLIIPAQPSDKPFAREAIRRTARTLGQPDIFIDYSSQSSG